MVVVDDGDGPTLSVIDQGPGFPPQFREIAFAEFSRSESARDRVSGGAGLGLAIARGLILAHRGEIWIPEGKGGRVTFRLPPADDTAPPMPESMPESVKTSETMDPAER